MQSCLHYACAMASCTLLVLVSMCTYSASMHTPRLNVSSLTVTAKHYAPVAHFNEHAEDRVTPRALSIHLSAPHLAHPVASIEQSAELLRCGSSLDNCSLHKDHLLFIQLDVQLGGLGVTGVLHSVEQVPKAI
eukprot:15075-Heterococcus_DN1.PRE.2